MSKESDNLEIKTIGDIIDLATVTAIHIIPLYLAFHLITYIVSVKWA